MANPYLINGVASPQSLYEVFTTPAHKPGTRGVMDDGRVFFYTKNATSAALAPGKLFIRSVPVPHHAECDVTTGAQYSTTISGITIGATAMALNQYQYGYLVVTDGAGEGHTYRIKEHAAALASATTVAVTLFDEIIVALDTNSTVTFVTNAYVDPIISATTVVDIPVGVACVNIPAGNTTTQYGWLQTWGECGVLQDESIAALGSAMTVGTGVAGALEEDDTATTVSQEFVVGFSITATADTEYSPVFLMIRP